MHSGLDDAIHIIPDEGVRMSCFPVTHIDKYMSVIACSVPSIHASWQAFARYALGSCEFSEQQTLQVEACVL